MAQGGPLSADTSSEHLRNWPSIGNMQELARSLMASLDITKICCNLLEELKKMRHSSTSIPPQTIQEEYRVCLQCCRCLISTCPHHSEPAAGQDLPMLVITLHNTDILVHEEDLQLDLRLRFELAVDGEPPYVWDTTQRLPEIAPERCCKNCNAPLPRSPGDRRSSQASHPVLRPRRTQKGQRRRDRQDARAPERAEHSDTSSTDLHPDGQEDPLPTVVPTSAPSLSSAVLEPVPTNALFLSSADLEPVPTSAPSVSFAVLEPVPTSTSPPSLSSAVLEGTQSVEKQALPHTDQRDLRQRSAVQRVVQSWQMLKASMQRNIGDKVDELLEPESPEPSSTTEGKQRLTFNLLSKVDTLFHAADLED